MMHQTVITSSEIQSLPPLPISVVRIAQIMAEPDVEVEEVTHVIELDPVLTGHVLNWANSSWSSSQTQISSVWNAVVRLGADNVLKLAIGSHLKKPMIQNSAGYGYVENQLWQHGVASALTAEMLNRVTLEVIPPSAFAASLMHDIGKLILGRHFTQAEHQQGLAELKGEPDQALLEFEEKITGTHHAAVGERIAREWKLPEDMIQAIANHHTPENDPQLLTDAVYFANKISKLIDGSEAASGNYRVSPLVMQRLKVNNTHIQTIATMVVEQFEETTQKWEIQ